MRIFDITWRVLGREAFFYQHRDVGHVLVLLGGHVLWISQVGFPWKSATHPLKHIVSENFKISTSSVGFKEIETVKFAVKNQEN